MKTATKTKTVKIEVEKTVTRTLSDTIFLKVPADYTEEQIRDAFEWSANIYFDLDNFLTNEQEETDISTSILGTATKRDLKEAFVIDLASPGG